MEIRSLSKHFNIHFNVLSVAGRNLIFCFNFQATQPKQCFSTYPWPLTLQVSFPITNFIFLWVSIFVLSFRNAQNTQNVNDNARILVDNSWKFKSNTFL